MKRIYLDYAATTPVDLRAARVMIPFFSEKFGNTMSLHSFGREAELALEKSREKVADLIGAKPEEIIFTGSATESNNFVLKGIEAKHIIISQIEHSCIMESAVWLEKRGVEITRLPVDKYGLVSPESVRKAIKKNTALVSVIHVSNEIGIIEPIEKIGAICREKKVLFHTDAAQSFGKIPLDVKKQKIDFLTASSHKIYGPKGAAILFTRKGVSLEPLLHGGGQEKGLRSSTVNLPAIVGFGRACEIAEKEMEKENKRISKLRNKLVKNVLKIKNSHFASHPKKGLPNILSFLFDFIEGESLMLQLDLKGIACSTGSACSSQKLEPSSVLLAIGIKPEKAHGSLRISLGRQTKEKDIDYLIKVLPPIVKKLRKISPYG